MIKCEYSIDGCNLIGIYIFSGEQGQVGLYRPSGEIDLKNGLGLNKGISRQFLRG